MRYLDDLHFANLNAHCHAGGYFRKEDSTVWEYGTHRFVQNKFYFVSEGYCDFFVDGNTVEGIPGRLFFLPAGTVHAYHSSSEMHYCHYWMHFDLMPLDSDLFGKLNLPFYIDIPIDGEIAGKFKEFAACVRGVALPDKIRTKALVLSVLADYIQVALPEDVGITSASGTHIREVLDYINDHIREDISNTALAERFHMHPNHFVRYFKSNTGTTPAKYVSERRMENAKLLLEESRLSPSEIMEQVGLTDLSHFSKLFKKHYGDAPRKYREKLRLAVPFDQ